MLCISWRSTDLSPGIEQIHDPLSQRSGMYSIYSSGTDKNRK